MCQHLPSRQASCYHHTLSDELVADQVNNQVNKLQLTSGGETSTVGGETSWGRNVQGAKHTLKGHAKYITHAGEGAHEDK